MLNQTFVQELAKLPKDIANAVHNLRVANDLMQTACRERGIDFEQEFAWAKHPPSRPEDAEWVVNGPGRRRK